MKKTAKQELRTKTVPELQRMVDDLRGRLLKGRIAKAVEGQGLGPRSRQIRREIARLLTFISEKQIAEVQR